MKRLLAKLSLEPDPDPQYRKRFETTTSQSLDSHVTAHSTQLPNYWLIRKRTTPRSAEHRPANFYRDVLRC
jgi:hypothetical protein